MFQKKVSRNHGFCVQTLSNYEEGKGAAAGEKKKRQIDIKRYATRIRDKEEREVGQI